MEGIEYWRDRPRDDSRKDWRDDADWIMGYWNSQSHPHRRLIVDALARFNPTSVLEIGCNAGPNLVRIRDAYPNVRLVGIDANKDAIDFARENLPHTALRVGDLRELPFDNGDFDVVVSDAALMYVSPEDIYHTMREILRVARKGVVFVEWHDESLRGKEVDYHWARDYKALLETYGLMVTERKLTEEDWPSRNWVEHGYLWIGTCPDDED